MFDPFEVDPAMPNNPHLPTNRPMSPHAKLAVTIHKQTVGLSCRRQLRLSITGSLCGKIIRHSTNELSEKEVSDILDRIFPNWKQDVFYPPMETRKALRAIAEYLANKESEVQS